MSSPRSEQLRGHLIVRTGAAAVRSALEHAERLVESRGYREYVERLWAALPMLSPQRYRGVSRDPLTRIFDGEVESIPGVGADWVARVKMRERPVSNPDRLKDWDAFDPDLVEDLTFAREVAAATDRPSDWEVVVVDRESRERADLALGFDVGTWGGDHTSIVCDAMLVPMWHGPPPAEFEELLPHARRLNEHQLFDSWEHASAYREWYRGRRWAGTEVDDEFRVIRVDAAPPAT